MASDSEDDSYQFNCLIEGEFITFTVIMDRNYVVDRLKRVIQDMRQRAALKDVDPPTLDLWKVSATEALRY